MILEWHLEGKTEKEIRDFRVIHGGDIVEKEVDEATGLINVHIVYDDQLTRRYSEPISSRETYRQLSDNAKKVFGLIKFNDDEETLSVQAGKEFVFNDGEHILITSDLYQELFDFVRPRYSGIGWYVTQDEENKDILHMYLHLDTNLRIDTAE